MVVVRWEVLLDASMVKTRWGGLWCRNKSERFVHAIFGKVFLFLFCIVHGVQGAQFR